MRTSAILATGLLATSSMAYHMVEMDEIQFGVVRYPEMSLYRRQSQGGCQDNTKACSNFCIAKDEECCEDGTSCFNDERCQKGSDGVWGCCEKGKVCLGSVSTAFESAAPSTAAASTATGSSSGGSAGGNPAAKGGQSSGNAGNARVSAGPMHTAAAVVVGALALL